MTGYRAPTNPGIDGCRTDILQLFIVDLQLFIVDLVQLFVVDLLQLFVVDLLP